MKLKALSLTQPYASLVMLGAKKIETRSWATQYRGLLAIHAAKRFPPHERRLACSYSFYHYLDELRDSETDRVVKNIPLGAIIAVAELTAVYRIPETARHFPWNVPDDHPLSGTLVTIPPFPESFMRGYYERDFGDYAAGRWAWLLPNMRRLKTPFPINGKLGLWDVELPDDVEYAQ